MAYRKLSEGIKSKPRGRPFKKRIESREPENGILDITRHSISTEGGILKKIEIGATKNGSEISVLNRIPSFIMQIDKNFKECLYNPLPIETESLEMDSIDFTNGENTLSIKLFKKQNRMFRIQIFLNKTIEIRNVTYAGNSTAYNFWNLLKGSLK